MDSFWTIALSWNQVYMHHTFNRFKKKQTNNRLVRHEIWANKRKDKTHLNLNSANDKANSNLEFHGAVLSNKYASGVGSFVTCNCLRRSVPVVRVRNLVYWSAIIIGAHKIQSTLEKKLRKQRNVVSYKVLVITNSVIVLSNASINNYTPSLTRK